MNNVLIDRDLLSTINNVFRYFSVLTLTGPRQSGKTTLCKMAFPDYEYVNLERATTRALVEHDIEGFLHLGLLTP